MFVNDAMMNLRVEAEQNDKCLCDGMYMQGNVEGVSVLFTADTGASRTVISTRIYDNIDSCRRPQLKSSACLKGAGGKTIKEREKSDFTLRLGSLEIVRDAMVAEIEDDVLLGYDILGGSENGAADILLSQNKLVLDGIEIPCFQIGRNKVTRKVTVADDCTLPGLSETLVDVYIERTEEDDIDSKADFLLEPTDKFKERYPLLMAASLININQGPTCKVRILTPFSSDLYLKQDVEVGKAEKIERVISIFAKEERTESDLHSTRRVKLGPQQSPRDIKSRTLATEDEVPINLKSLLERSTEGKNSYERQVLAGVLIKYQDTFSKYKWDIGLTHLTEHQIKTGDEDPIFVGDQHMVVLSKEDSIRWHTRNAVIVEEDIFAEEEDETVIVHGMALPSWAASPSMTSKVPEYNPTPLSLLPTVTSGEKPEYTATPLDEATFLPTLLQETVPGLFTLPMVQNFPATTPARPEMPKINTPCLDERMLPELSASVYQDDPIFKETPLQEEVEETPAKRRRSPLSGGCHDSSIAEAITNGLKMLASVMEQNTRAIRCQEKVFGRPVDELVRIERRLAQMEKGLGKKGAYPPGETENQVPRKQVKSGFYRK